MMEKVRVRFAPSPTGPLHIGGVRTALFNYLFAKQNNGTFILRIEDTDQTRYVPGAEEYIIQSLNWIGFVPEEGPTSGGAYGPYRQSERKHIYEQYARELVDRGFAYLAFDTAEELDVKRETEEDFKYNFQTRNSMRNSLSLSEQELKELTDAAEPYTIRLKVPSNEIIEITDLIRGTVEFQSAELDDKILLKGDGMPTYHLANIVDDHLMDISHVIRGEEWLSSTAHHLLLYRFLGWNPPTFAHLPLILKPTGQGKLSKRDGAKFGFPVFPLNWYDEEEKAEYPGFKEVGFLPEALTNFLVLLGWNPGNDEEIFSLDQLIQLFDLSKVSKGGARFDFEKAKWTNQQYILAKSNEQLAKDLVPLAEQRNLELSESKLIHLASMMKERVHVLAEFFDSADFLFGTPKFFDSDTFTKKYAPELSGHFERIASTIESSADFSRNDYESFVKDYIQEHQLKMGQILPVLRIALTGTMQGPDLFETISFLGPQESSQRILTSIKSV